MDGQQGAAGQQQQQRALPPTGWMHPGQLRQYYNDLASGLIAPEDMRIEDLSFRAQISPLGEVTFESPAVTLVSRYNFAFRRAVGFAMNPDLVGAAPMLIGFNVKEQGRNFTVFKKPVAFSSVINTAGGIRAEWDGVYITVPGTDLAVEWFIDTQRWAALVGTTQEIGVSLLGDYVVCKA